MTTLRSRINSGGLRLHVGAVQLPVRIFGPEDEWNVSASYYRVAPGDIVSPHYHLRKTELWFVISGRALVRWGDERIEVEEGSAVITPPHVVHGVPAVLGDEPLVFVNFATPPNPEGPDRYAGTIEVED